MHIEINFPYRRSVLQLLIHIQCRSLRAACKMTAAAAPLPPPLIYPVSKVARIIALGLVLIIELGERSVAHEPKSPRRCSSDNSSSISASAFRNAAHSSGVGSCGSATANGRSCAGSERSTRGYSVGGPKTVMLSAEGPTVEGTTAMQLRSPRAASASVRQSLGVRSRMSCVSARLDSSRACGSGSRRARHSEYCGSGRRARREGASVAAAATDLCVSSFS